MKSRAIVLPAELQKQLSSAVGFKFNILPECSNLENKGEPDFGVCSPMYSIWSLASPPISSRAAKETWTLPSQDCRQW